MIQRLFFGLLILAAIAGCTPNDGYTYALISTDFGDMKVKLYNSTPQHRDNFIKLASEGYYDGTLFHRVISGFMIQGGDPDSRDAAPGVPLGAGGPGYTIPAEIGALHIKGALAAARTNNPQKASSGSQFYVVHGKAQDDVMLQNAMNRSRRQYSEMQMNLYKELGGTPMLDFEYTVFGEVVEGMDVIDAIAEVATAPGDRPLEDVKMTVKILN